MPDKEIPHAQELIQNLTTTLVPLSITLPMVPDELRQPCTALYNYTQALLKDMLEKTEDYEIADKNDVWFYIRTFFEWMYKKFQYADNAFIAGKASYKKYIKKLNQRHVEWMLTHHGYKVETDGDNIRITNNKYPGMLKAVFELLKAANKNYSVNRTDYLTKCDFRALVNYKRTYDDMLLLLNDEGKELAQRLYEYAAGIRVKPVKCTYFCRVEFKKKGKVIFVLDVIDQKYLKINIGFAEIGGEAFKMIEKEIAQYDDKNDFIYFWRKNLKKCTNCTPDCRKKSHPIEVFGKKTLVCQAYIRMYHPNKQDLEYIYRLISLRTMVVDAGISEPFYPGNG